MKKSIWKRLLSLALAFVLVAGMAAEVMPIPAKAKTTTDYGFTVTVNEVQYYNKKTGERATCSVSSILLYEPQLNGHKVTMTIKVICYRPNGVRAAVNVDAEFEVDCAKPLSVSGTRTPVPGGVNQYTYDYTITREAGSHTGNATCTKSAKCTACNRVYTDPNKHSYVWKHDGTQHWQECTENSSHTTPKVGHSGGTATCVAPATCSTCKTPYGTVNSQNHSWGAWVFDNSTHTRTCTLDASHTETGGCSGGTANCTELAVCDTCKNAYGRTNDSHNWGEWESDGTQHWQVCTRNTNHTSAKTNCSGGTANCTELAVCDTCKNAYGSTNDSHSWDPWKSNGNDTHTRVCNLDGSHTETDDCAGGAATCTDPAVCATCATAYGTEQGHAPVYTLDGNVLTENCSRCDHIATATLDAEESYVYTGSAITPATITYSDNWLGEQHEDITYENNLNVPTTGKLPTAKITVEDKELTKTFQITPADIGEATVVLNPDSGTYNGKAHKPEISLTWKGAALVEGVHYQVSWDKSGLADADTYCATIAGIGNYGGTTSATYTIGNADLREIYVLQEGTLIYNGTAQTPTVNAHATTVNNQPVTFTYSLERNGVYGEMPTFTEAGTYMVYYKVSAPNHDGVQSNFAVTVDKAVVTEPTLEGKPYNGKAQTADIADTDLYTVVQNAGGTEKGEYEVVLKLKDAENYIWSTTVDAQVSVSFAITAEKNVWITEPAIEGWKYGEDANEPVYKAKFGWVNVRYTGTANDGTAWDSKEAPTKAGSYTATFTVAATENYSGLRTVVAFTVAMPYATENTEKVENITPENVKPEDKPDLEKAKEDLEKALEESSVNYSDDEKQDIQDEIARIDGAMDVIEDVEAVEELIGKIPGTVAKDDEPTIKAADDAYNALNDYAKSLVDEDARKTLEDAKKALTEMNGSAATDATADEEPEAEDGNYWWLWLLLLIAVCAGFVLFLIARRKKKEE